MTFHILDPNTDKVRFDYAAMQQEWIDFLETACDQETADPALVAALTKEHAVLFSDTLGETGIKWHDLEGVFAIPPWLVNVDQLSFSRSDLDMVWSNCFDYTNERFDEIEDRVKEERAYGLF